MIKTRERAETFDSCMHEAEAYLRIAIAHLSYRNDVPDGVRKYIADTAGAVGDVRRKYQMGD